MDTFGVQEARTGAEDSPAEVAFAGAPGETGSTAQLARKMNEGPRADSISALSSMMEGRAAPAQRAENRTGMPDGLRGGIGGPSGVGPVQMAAAPRHGVTQRQVSINGLQWDIEMGMPIDDLAQPLKNLYVSWRDDDVPRNFKGTADLAENLRGEWWKIPEQETMALSTVDPLYKHLVSSTMKNHEERPYATDALHETSPFMSTYLNEKSSGYERFSSGMSSLLSYQTLFGKQSTDRPSFEISRVEMIKNPKLFSRYVKAYQDISKRGNPNEMMLYSGHSTSGMDFISKEGHDPSYGTYDPKVKGHGAHGRGAYFTDRVDKAVSYSSKDQGPDEERSFFLQSVLLGNSLKYDERGKFRHRHHNEMVREDRSESNKLRLKKGSGEDIDDTDGSFSINIKSGEGEDAPEKEDMSQYDSLIGQQSYESGSGIFGTINNRNAFDSTEYMIRNGDQVYPSYRIYYKLAKQSQQSQSSEISTDDTVIDFGNIQQGGSGLDKEERKENY